MQLDPHSLLREALHVAAPRAPLARIRRRARDLAVRERSGRSMMAIAAGAVLMSALLLAFFGHGPQTAGGIRIPLASATAGASVPAPLPTIT